MGKVLYFISLLFIIKSCNSSVNGYKFFQNKKLLDKVNEEPSKFERWFTQNLDHFSPTDERQWQQRYFVNDEFFNNATRDVAFLYIEGEGEASDIWMTSGSWYPRGKEYKAILFELEHRFYGKSRPTEDTSVENLVYLTSQQAIADIAFFVSAMNKKYQLSPDVKWILFGGSYAGSLVAWTRQRYPYLIHGAMSASGPLLAKMDFPEYFEVVEEVLRADSEECATALKIGIDQIEASLHGKNGQNVTDEFNLCDNIYESLNNPNDITNFYLNNIAATFASIVQSNHLEPLRVLNISVERICDMLTNKNLGNELSRVSAVSDFFASLSNLPCIDYKYEKTVSDVRNTSWEASAAGRPWTYQTCTEFGFYQTSYKPQVFGNTIDLQYYIKMCEDTFGPEFNKTFIEKAVDRTNVLYGGKEIEVSNVVFVHGDSDPWHVLGKTHSSDASAPVIIIEGAAHCATMFDPSDNDSPQLVEARKQIGKIIGSWLGF